MIISQLIQTAITARNNAQAPYSKYHVGAAIRSTQGAIYAGCNVERCSYTQTTHAEQNAIDSMIATQGPAQITHIAVVAAPQNKIITVQDTQKVSIVHTPPQSACCGHCLQIIWENAGDNPQIPIYFFFGDDKIFATTIGVLLPFPFGPSNLGISYTHQNPFTSSTLFEHNETI